MAHAGAELPTRTFFGLDLRVLSCWTGWAAWVGRALSVQRGARAATARSADAISPMCTAAHNHYRSSHSTTAHTQDGRLNPHRRKQHPPERVVKGNGKGKAKEKEKEEKWTKKPAHFFRGGG